MRSVLFGFRPWVDKVACVISRVNNVNKAVFYCLLILLSTQAIYGVALMSARLSVLLQQHTFVAQLPAATRLKVTSEFLLFLKTAKGFFTVTAVVPFRTSSVDDSD